jgi:tRNA pseudouridine38-40 synthase
VKTLDRLDVKRAGEEIHVEAAARSFLHHQVRSMVGCLAMVGRAQWQPDDLRKALEAQDRAALGFNAPPHGLYFVEAIYPDPGSSPG